MRFSTEDIYNIQRELSPLQFDTIFSVEIRYSFQVMSKKLKQPFLETVSSVGHQSKQIWSRVSGVGIRALMGNQS